jgi:hypothetical protein
MDTITDHKVEAQKDTKEKKLEWKSIKFQGYGIRFTQQMPSFTTYFTIINLEKEDEAWEGGMNHVLSEETLMKIFSNQSYIQATLGFDSKKNSPEGKEDRTILNLCLKETNCLNPQSETLEIFKCKPQRTQELQLSFYKNLTQKNDISISQEDDLLYTFVITTKFLLPGNFTCRRSFYHGITRCPSL